MKAIFLIFTLFFVAPLAKAELFQGWEAEVGVEFPFQVSARAKTEVNDEYYITAGLGYAPSFLLDMNTSLVGAIAGKSTIDVFADSISNSIVIDLRGGWNFGGDGGLYIEAGYLYLMNGGKETDVSALEEAAGLGYAGGQTIVLATNSLVSAAANIHALTGHAGYRWQWGSLKANGSLGVIKPIFGSTTITFDQVIASGGSYSTAVAQANSLAKEAEKHMDSALLSSIFIPVASLWLTYEF